VQHFYGLTDCQIYDLTLSEFNRKLSALDKVLEYEILIVAGGIGKAFGGGDKDETSNEAAVRQMKSVGITPPSKY
jgi:hypothetical protein